MKSEEAVSEVLGMVMILSIMVTVIAVIMVAGVPMIESAKSRAKMDVAENAFFSVQSDIEEVVRGPVWVRDPRNPNVINSSLLGPSRVTEFDLLGGTLNVNANSTNVTYSINATSSINLTIPSGNITYSAGREFITFEDGAVIRKYETGAPLMVSDPLINIYDLGDNSNRTTVSIHVITLKGTNSSVGGDGRARVETRLKNYNQTIEPPSGSYANANQTNITIYSAYPEVWKKFFDEKLRRANLTSPLGYNITISAERLEVKIYGRNATNTNPPDIIFSLYETSLNVEVR